MTSEFQLTPTTLVPLGVAVALVAIAVIFGRIPLRYNIRNLRVRWLTTAMTAVAFTMVIGLLTVMLSFVKGMYKLTEGSGQPGNVILLSQGVPDEALSNMGFSDTGDIENQPGIRRTDDGQPMCSKETYVVVNQPIEKAAAKGPKRRFVQVRGLDDPIIAANVHGVELYDGGKWFSQAGVQAADEASGNGVMSESASGKSGSSDDAAVPEGGSAPEAAPTGDSRSYVEAVLGEGVARELGRDPTMRTLASVQRVGRLDTGDIFTLGGRLWRVTGVMRSAGSTFDSEIWAKRSLIAQLFGKEAYTSIVMRAQNVAAAKKLVTYFNEEFKKAAVQAQRETDYFASLSKTNEQFLYAITFIAIFLAIGGVFGVTNTMLAAVSQRTKDIGVLRILGYARWQILLCFLLESLFIALIGGALGCVLGALADGWTASSIVGNGQGGGKSVVLKLIVDADIVLKCMALSLVMGLIGGLYPALSTFRLRPLESLR